MVRPGVRREQERVAQPDLVAGTQQPSGALVRAAEEAELFACSCAHLVRRVRGIVVQGQVDAGVPEPVQVRCTGIAQPLVARTEPTLRPRSDGTLVTEPEGDDEDLLEGRQVAADSFGATTNLLACGLDAARIEAH